MGQAARWFVKQGPVSLVLTVAGMVAFAVSAFIITAALGWAVIGAGCWFLEYLTRQDTP
jgi:hypothetical protein